MATYKLDTTTVRSLRTTPALIAEILRNAIMRGELPGGLPLRQDELSAQFGLSRIPVREALRQLEGEGLVTIVPHRGAVVSSLSLEELQEICEIRVALETTALRLAIPHLDDESLARAEAILRATDAAEEVLDLWSANNWQFHATLYAPANRPRLLAMIKQLHDQVDRYLRLHVSLLDYKTKGQEEHWALLNACRARDAALAVTLLERHIETVGTLLARYLPHEQGAR
jgi:DNA-binding GntR family transcriptional regulator